MSSLEAFFRTSVVGSSCNERLCPETAGLIDLRASGGGPYSPTGPEAVVTPSGPVVNPSGDFISRGVHHSLWPCGAVGNPLWRLYLQRGSPQPLALWGCRDPLWRLYLQRGSLQRVSWSAWHQ
ncbi:unnamed protein product [Lota lota]